MRKSLKTKRRIKDAFISLMEEKPYDKIRVKEIAKRAEIQRSTFYQYFDGSYELMLGLEEELIANMRFYVWDPDREPCDLTIYPCIEDWFAYCIKHRRAIQVLFGPNGDPYFEKLFREQLCSDISQMMDDEGMPKDQLRDYCVELNYGIYSSLVRYAMQTAHMEGAMQPRALAGLANNWRASAIRAEQEAGLPIEDEAFQKFYMRHSK